MDTATKTGTYVAKAASKRVLQKTTEATGDLIRQLIKSLHQVKQTVKKKKTKSKKSIYHQKKESKLLIN